MKGTIQFAHAKSSFLVIKTVKYIFPERGNENGIEFKN